MIWFNREGEIYTTNSIPCNAILIIFNFSINLHLKESPAWPITPSLGDYKENAGTTIVLQLQIFLLF